MIVVASGTALSVSANAVSAEQVSGTYQIVPGGTVVLVTKGSATGLNVSLTVGGVPLCVDAPIPYTGTAGTISINDNVMVSQPVAGGKCELKFRNTTGGALTADYLLLFQ
jgi:hypothetical protein